MSRRLAFMILHTGAPYLRYAVQSILPQVDRLMIFYSAKPSQGFQTDIPCPDTRGELILMAHQAAWDVKEGHKGKVEWIEGEWSNETDHVNAVNAYTEGYDWLVRLDADEIFPDGMVDEMIRQADSTTHKNYRIPFCHFWRSFGMVCRDGSHPIRLTQLGEWDGNPMEGTTTLDSLNQRWEVLHFGYAQPTKYIEYKMAVSGHKSEWRPDWFKDRWLANAQRDVHPVMFPEHWHSQPYDKESMPWLMKTHPYYLLDPIE